MEIIFELECDNGEEKGTLQFRATEPGTIVATDPVIILC